MILDADNNTICCIDTRNTISDNIVRKHGFEEMDISVKRNNQWTEDFNQ